MKDKCEHNFKTTDRSTTRPHNICRYCGKSTDVIMKEEAARKARIREYKKLPTLQQLVESDLIIDPWVTYHTKEKGSEPDSCDGYSGYVILEMREKGIKAFWEAYNEGFIKWATTPRS